MIENKFDLQEYLKSENLMLLVASGGVMLIGGLMRKGLRSGWKKVRKTDPPLDPSDLDTGWGDALLWAGVSGITVGLTRLVTRRLAAEGIAKIRHKKSSQIHMK